MGAYAEFFFDDMAFGRQHRDRFGCRCGPSKALCGGNRDDDHLPFERADAFSQLQQVSGRVFRFIVSPLKQF